MQSFKQNMLLLIKRYGISMKIDVNIDACKQGERKALGNLYSIFRQIKENMPALCGR